MQKTTFPIIKQIAQAVGELQLAGGDFPQTKWFLWLVLHVATIIQIEFDVVYLSFV